MRTILKDHPDVFVKVAEKAPGTRLGDRVWENNDLRVDRGHDTQDGKVMIDWQRQKQTKQPALKKKSSHEKLLIQSFDPNDPDVVAKLKDDFADQVDNS